MLPTRGDHTNSIVNPIKDIGKAMKKLSVGDLKVSVKPTTKDEIGVLAVEINDTAKSLDGYVSEISRISGLMSNFLLTCSSSVFMVLASSSMEEACSVVPEASDCAPSEICVAPILTCAAAVFMVSIVSLRCSAKNEFIAQTVITSLIVTAVVALVCLIISAFIIVYHTNSIVNPIKDIGKADCSVPR